MAPRRSKSLGEGPDNKLARLVHLQAEVLGDSAPIWICEKCNEYEVIGSRSELESKAVDKGYVRAMTDLHKPYIDKVIIKCQKMRRAEQKGQGRLDVWFDSGMTFRLSVSEEQFARLFPVDFVVEYIEQVRAWFGALLKCGMLAYGKSPMKHIAVHGILLGSDGRKISKSLGNFIPINEIIKYLSADAAGSGFWITPR